jgi:succinoglycan biosynthesis transport protein ExoP
MMSGAGSAIMGCSPHAPAETAPLASALPLMADNPTSSPFPLSALLTTLWRHRWLAGSVGVAVAVLVALLSYAVTPLYRAEALLVVERGGRPLPFLSDAPDAKGVEFSLLNTQSALLRSHQVVSQALAAEQAAFDRSPDYARSGDRTQKLLDRLDIETNQHNWILHLGLVDADPELARTALASLIRCHLDNERRRMDDRSRSAIDFLRQAVDKARSDLARCRAEEAQFRRGNGLLSADPNRNLLVLEIESLHASRTQLESELTVSEAVMQRLALGDGVDSASARRLALMRIPEIHRDPLVAQMQQALLEATNRAFVLAQKYKPEHPQMRDAAKECASVQAQLESAVGLAASGLGDGHKALLGRQLRLGERISALETALVAYRERMIDLQALSLTTSSAEQLFQTVDRNLQEEEISSRRQHLEVTVADPPHVTSWPINLRRSLFVLSGGIIGLIAAVTVALLADLFERRLSNPDAVRQITSLPTLGYIPHVLALQVPGRPEAVRPQAQGVIDEAFRLLSSTIQLKREIGSGPRVMVVTSPGGADGRTTVAARLAMTLAASGSRVLLIDGDLRQPGLHRQFDLAAEAGVSDLLQGREAVVVPTGYTGLELLSAGTAAEHSMALPSIASFREMLATFAGSNRYVIIDSPPLAFSEALVMCGVAHDILLVIRDGFTGKEALRQAQLRLAPLLAQVLGLVINDDHGTAPAGSEARIIQTGVFIRLRPDPPVTGPKRGPPGPDDPVVIEE